MKYHQDIISQMINRCKNCLKSLWFKTKRNNDLFSDSGKIRSKAIYVAK